MTTIWHCKTCGLVYDSEVWEDNNLDIRCGCGNFVDEDDFWLSCFECQHCGHEEAEPELSDNRREILRRCAKCGEWED